MTHGVQPFIRQSYRSLAGTPLRAGGQAGGIGRVLKSDNHSPHRVLAG